MFAKVISRQKLPLARKELKLFPESNFPFIAHMSESSMFDLSSFVWLSVGLGQVHLNNSCNSCKKPRDMVSFMTPLNSLHAVYFFMPLLPSTYFFQN